MYFAHMRIYTVPALRIATCCWRTRTWSSCGTRRNAARARHTCTRGGRCRTWSRSPRSASCPSWSASSMGATACSPPATASPTAAPSSLSRAPTACSSPKPATLCASWSRPLYAWLKRRPLPLSPQSQRLQHLKLPSAPASAPLQLCLRHPNSLLRSSLLIRPLLPMETPHPNWLLTPLKMQSKCRSPFPHPTRALQLLCQQLPTLTLLVPDLPKLVSFIHSSDRKLSIRFILLHFTFCLHEWCTFRLNSCY